MKNYKKATAATLAALTILLSACGGGSDPVEEQANGVIDLESANKVLYFYGASSEDHYAFYTETGRVENLNDDNKTDMRDADPTGRLFYWLDNRGDTNASNDEGKVVMFKSTYDLLGTGDANATWEEFYYLDHLSGDERHPHENIEFNVTSGSKLIAMERLNTYLQKQEDLKNDLNDIAVTTTEVLADITSICNLYTSIHEHDGDIEKHHFVLGTNGRLYTFHDEDGTIEFNDQTVIADSCEVGKSGISEAAEGVIVYLQNTAKLYLVDSHGDGVTHVHSDWDLSQVLGNGKSIDMMVGIGSVEHEDDHVH